MNDNNQKLFRMQFTSMSHTYALVIKSLTREMLDEEKSFIKGIELPHTYEYDTKKECVDVKIYEDDIAAKKLWCCFEAWFS